MFALLPVPAVVVAAHAVEVEGKLQQPHYVIPRLAMARLVVMKYARLLVV